jgi:PadR family transcriptional regulator PadR
MPTFSRFVEHGLDAEDVTPTKTKGRSRVRVLQHFEHSVLLSVLSLGTKSFPAEIARRLTKTLDRHVSLAQVFTALQRMEERGLVSSQESDPEPVRGGRRRRIFRLEASGEHALRETAATFRRMSSKSGNRTETADVKGSEPTPSPA